MSVIFGVNLSDRVYLAGDSRVSDLATENGEEFVVPKSDNILKVDLVRGNSGVVLACAGDAKFAKYILKGLYKEPFSQKGATSIRENIETWIKQRADQYFTESAYSVANFIFAGSDTSRRKSVAANRILTLAKAYLGEKGQGSMKGHVAEALERHADEHDNKASSARIELAVADTILFSVKVSKAGVSIEDTEFGQYLLYGPEGLVKEDITDRYIGQLEYSRHGSSIEKDVGLIIAMLQDLIETKGLESIGGCVVPLGAFADGAAYFIDGDLNRIDLKTGRAEIINRFRLRGGTFYRIDDRGTWHRMIKVVDYKGIGSGHLLL